MRLSTLHCALILLVLLLAGCGSSAQPTAEPGPALPLPLPETAGEASGGLPRSTSAEVELHIKGSEFLQKNPSSVPSGDVLFLVQASDPLCYGLYGAALGAQQVLTRLQVMPVQEDVDYYLALANYALGRWEILPAPQTGNADLPIASWADYASPSGSFYFAVIGPAGVMTLDESILTIDDSSPLPAPTNLAGQAQNAAAQLTWDAYSDPRADSLRLYQGSDEQLSDASLIATLEPDELGRRVTGLTNDTTYYFALTAYWDAEPLESPQSNVVSVTPQSDAGVLLSGLWARRGNSGDNSGATSAVGPPSFDMSFSVDIADGRSTMPNRTTPAIDDTGGVYALTGDAVLCKYSSDLSTREWSFAAADNAPESGVWFSPSHSPVLDSAGNAYFVAAADSSSKAQSYIFCVDAEGNEVWDFPAGALPTNVDYPYPTPNITADGTLIAMVEGLHTLVGIDSAGVEAFRYEFGEQIEIHGELAISGGGKIEMPAWFSGIGVGPLEHWVSLNAADGTFFVDYQTLGGPANIHGGLPMRGGFHVYPEQNRLMLLDATTGEALSNIEGVEPWACAAARSMDGDFIFIPHVPYGFSGLGDLRCYSINEAVDPPAVEQVYIKQIGSGTVAGQPAIDRNNTAFIADYEGVLWRIEFDSTQPVSETNPSITDQQELTDGDTYYYNSFALGAAEVAYIVNESNDLYVIWNPLDS